ncbi:XRE family transcriptional regulator [Clostridium sp. BSD9I1]|uniref:XRE family transcriptional regulator n=1 Tax=Clostridium sp. BSD9I1 TaxID=2003589 RepID=UPI0016492B36|nr:XRE family transcriptional regulator [Clostridium sp. BSD9I1]
MDSNILGFRIKKLREDANISQLDLAKYLNIGNTTLSQYESGKRVPSDSIKRQIAEHFNVSLDYLMGYSDIKEQADKILNNKETTIALHNENGYDENLPPEAKKELEDFIEFLKHKYGKNK